MEGHLSREVVHATGVHEAQRVPHSLCTQHMLACDWADAAVGQRSGHDTPRLAGDIDGAQLRARGQPHRHTG